MKKKLKLFSVLTIMIAIAAMSAIILTGCGLSDEEKEAVGKYNLISISGISGVSVSSYEYNYVELLGDKTYKLENKYGGIVTSQTGNWSLEGENIIFTVKSGSTTVKETYKISNGVITMSMLYNGTTITLVLQKEAAPE